MNEYDQLKTTLRNPAIGQGDPNVSIGQNLGARRIALDNALRQLASQDLNQQALQDKMMGGLQQRQQGQDDAGPMDWISGLMNAGGGLKNAYDYRQYMKNRNG